MAASLKAPSLSALSGIQHGFFTRRGGVSGGDYTSLNCGPGSKDSPNNVAENRARVALKLGAKPEHLITVWQVHGATALAVSGPWPDPERRPQADAMVTATPGLVLGSLTADCVPVLFADPQARVIGAAHAGWKGALAGILESTITAMEGLGARRARIQAVIGPAIGPKHYEVGDEFERRFLDASLDNARFFRRPPGAARPFFDLPGFAATRLIAAGAGVVADIARCTYEGESEFFSFRRATHLNQADYGRQISAIVLE